MTPLESAAEAPAQGVPSPATPGAAAKAPAPLRGHLPALDGVRGLAILMVLLLHFVGQMQVTSFPEKAVAWILGFGAYGVELFFVLSGFLITGILFDSRLKPHYFRNFYVRRLLRIFPLYYGVLAALFFIAPLFPAFQSSSLEFMRQKQAWAWLYGVNIFISIHGEWALGYIDHFWSLCVEEHFYFVWPLMVWLLGKRPARLMWISLSLATGAMLARIAANFAGVPWWSTYVLTPFRLDGLALGGFLALLVRQPEGLAKVRRHLPRVAMIAGVLFAASLGAALLGKWGPPPDLSSGRVPYLYPFRVALIMVLLAALLMWALVAPERSSVSRFFRSRAMTFLGTYSYGLYVYHHFISYYMATHRTEFALARWLGVPHFAAVLVQSAAGALASLLVAYLSYELFEKRFLSLKRFFEAER